MLRFGLLQLICRHRNCVVAAAAANVGVVAKAASVYVVVIAPAEVVVAAVAAVAAVDVDAAVAGAAVMVAVVLPASVAYFCGFRILSLMSSIHLNSVSFSSSSSTDFS